MPGSSEPGAKRYRISALLGKGSSGRIYRAVLEESSGQETDVAVKLLRDEDVEVLTLPRLREEARLLGLVRDKALVRVEPPVRLTASDPKVTDRWALVMDLVTGVSLQRLTSQGALPPSVVCEIVGEVARVLDKVWQAPGPDGKPLRILHRDLKPSNLQINSAGKLWVLDFGIVKADFKSRDGQTTAYATGTRGFIAPERLEEPASDTPAGDIFSLGVTAQSLMEEDRTPFGQLITLMQSVDPADRPTARDVEEQCARLRRRMDGMTLREWAERYVSKAIAVRFSDEFVNKVLTETAPPATRVRVSQRSKTPEPSKTPAPARVNRASATPLAGAFGEGKLSSETPPTANVRASKDAPVKSTATKDARGFRKKGKSDDDETVVLPSESYLSMLEDDEPSGRSGAQRAQPGRDPGGSLEASLTGLPPRVPQSRTGQSRLPPGLGDALTEIDTPRKVHSGGNWMLGLAAMGLLAVLVLMFSTLVGAAGMWWLWPEQVAERASVRDEPRIQLPPQPQLSTTAAEADQRLTFSSIPLGVDVYIDRKPIGQTPVVGVMVPPGQHELILVSDFEKLVRKIDVGKKKPVRYVWKGGETWETHY
jgi:serine/threonine protein kinase